MGIAAIFAIVYTLIGLGLGAFWPSLLGSDDGNPTGSRRRELRRAELMSAFSNSPVPHKAKFAVYEGIIWIFGAALC
jgi:hypothetical protein